jgi:hypothetical protein
MKTQEKFVMQLSAAVDEHKGTCDCNQELAIALGTSWLIASESSSAGVAQIQPHSCIIAGCIRESIGCGERPFHSPKVPRTEPTDRPPPDQNYLSVRRVHLLSLSPAGMLPAIIIALRSWCCSSANCYYQL